MIDNDAFQGVINTFVKDDSQYPWEWKDSYEGIIEFLRQGSFISSYHIVRCDNDLFTNSALILFDLLTSEGEYFKTAVLYCNQYAANPVLFYLEQRDIATMLIALSHSNHFAYCTGP